MKRCTRCVLPETYPEISYDDQGVCNHCRSFKSIVYKGEEALRKLFEENSGSGKWDCLVPLSGGRDSTYTLYNLVKKYGRRVLVYNYDNGFVESIAQDNIKAIARIGANEEEKDHELKIIDKVLARMELNEKESNIIRRFCQGDPVLKNSWQ